MKILNCAYSFTDNYSQHAGLSMLSLFENNQDADEINVYIIDSNIGTENKSKLENLAAKYKRRIIYLDLTKLSAKMDIDTTFNRSAYGRIFLPQLKEVDLMLYFDSDTIVAGNLSKLLDLDMSDTLVAGVQDTVNSYFVHKTGLKNSDRYINSGGVLVLNLKLWRELGIENRCIDYIKSENGNPPFDDQGTINNVCKDKIKILPPEYNVMNPMFMFPVKKIKSLFKMETYYTQEEIDNAIAHPKVIHYTGELYNRPWFKNCTHPLKQVYQNYLSRSPWKDNEPEYKEMTKNCRIQKRVYENAPFWVYKAMIRFIEYRHKVQQRIK